MSTSRVVYNKTVELINNGYKPNFQDLRNRLVTAKDNDLPEYELNTPKEIRAGAVKDVTSAYSTCRTLLSMGLIKFFDFKTKKEKEMSIKMPILSILNIVNDLDCTKFMVYPSKTNREYIKVDKNIKLYKRDIPVPISNNRRTKVVLIDYDTRIQYKKGQYFLLVPVEYCRQEVPKLNTAVSGDLGVRTFLTTFSNEEVIEFKRHNLKKLHNKIDILKMNHKKKRYMSKVESRLENIVTDLHWKTAHYLTSNYDTIFLGKLESQKCVRGNIDKSVKRMTNELRFYQFKQRLVHLSKQRSCTLKIVHESYTSQICPNCVQLTKTSEKTYVCKHCSYTIDRDILGSRNIMIKGLVQG
jgi:putative transposase